MPPLSPPTGMAAPDDGRPRRDRQYWRSLAERHELALASGEFTPAAEQRPDALSRRDLLRLLSASMALAGLAGCAPQAHDQLVPFAERPADAHGTRSVQYATTMSIDGLGTGLVVETHNGRPTKIEGNPDHPASLGACGVFEQASLLQLYDPDRARSVRLDGQPCVWSTAVAEIAARHPTDGAGLRLLIEPTAAPTFIGLLSELRRRWPAARTYLHDPAGRGPGAAAAQALRALCGRTLVARPDLARAAIVAAFDADPLAQGPGNLAQARAFTAQRRLRASGQAGNRLYVAESSPSCSGNLADHRLRASDHGIGDLLAALLAELAGAHGVDLPAPVRHHLDHAPLEPGQAAWIRAVADDLVRHRGAAVVLVGERQPPLMHALGCAINAAMGAHGATIAYAPSPLFAGDGDAADLASDLERGQVQDLVICGANVLATSPGDLRLGELLARAGHRLYLGAYEDETAAHCEGFIPQAHYLESWGDACAYDGTRSIQQPMCGTLHGGVTPLAIVATLLGKPAGDRQLVLASWRGAFAGDDVAFADHIDEVLRRGVAANSALAAVAVMPDWSALDRLGERPPRPAPFELSLRLDSKVHDGRFANNPWLQELPHPVSKLTWDNAALMCPSTAAGLALAQGDLIEITSAGRRIILPVLLQPGQAASTITVDLGYGRRGSERTAAGVGADAYPLRTSKAPWSGEGISVRKADGSHMLALTQSHWSLEGRPIVRERTVEEFAYRTGDHEPEPPQASLRAPAVAAHGPQWAMVVDLSVCIGCSACVVACQAENNIPVVGKDNVLRSREMHWLRVDRYYRGEGDDPEAFDQPMACQHCEKAPCEYVCPTYATTHSSDGLNEMTYNRCVGTRFCSNNCPYKVRRFNWYNFHVGQDPLLQLGRNPDVTVRDRGVMEKCTYCVQRIRSAEHAATASGTGLRTDQVMSACQQTCPTQAIIFGDLSDPHSAVARARLHPLAYAVLDDIDTQPRTRYVERLRNPHPGLA